MRSSLSLCLLPLFTLSSLSAHLQTHPLIFNRQTADCIPQFYVSQPSNSIECGSINTYISDKCTCCSSGTLGCYSQNVCAIDPYGGNMCCPLDNPTCSDESGNGGDGGSAASTTSVDNSPAAPTSNGEGNGSGQAAATTTGVAPVGSGGAVALKVEGTLSWVAMVFFVML